MSRIFAVGLLIAAAVTACTKGTDEGKVLPGNEPAGGYPISVGAGENSTRAELGDDMVFRWSAPDRVGFYMVPHGGVTPIASNVRLTSVNKTPERVADFEGEMTRTQVSQVADKNDRFDYYSYYPYDANVSAGSFPNMTFSLSSVRTVKPDTFGAGCVMIASATDKTPVTYLEDGVQRFGERLSFTYSHVFSYVELYLACNLMSQRIVKIKITDKNGGVLAGDCKVDMTTGAYTMSNTSSTVTLNIDGGMDVLDGVIYLPIPAADLRSHQFSFELTTEHGNTVVMGEKMHSDAPAETIYGGNFQKAKIHKLGLKVPFHLKFAGMGSSHSFTGKNNDFTFKNYTFGGNGKPTIDGDRINFYAASNRTGLLNIASGGDIDKNNDGRGDLRLPKMNVKNTAGRDDIPVQIQMVGNTEGVSDGAKPGSYPTYGRYYFVAVNEEFSSYLNITSAESSGYNYIKGVQSAFGYTAQEYSDSGTKYAYVTGANPCVVMHYVGNFIGANIKNQGHIYEIKLVPKY